MKKTLLVILTLGLLLSLAFANDLQIPTNLKPVATPQGISIPATRVAPEYTFTKLPTAIITNYYDYMIGSYNGLPLRNIPDVAGGGYFMSYHGRRQPTSTRRAFYAYIDAQGNVVNNNEITSVQNNEGYPTAVVDPVSGFFVIPNKSNPGDFLLDNNSPVDEHTFAVDIGCSCSQTIDLYM